MRIVVLMSTYNGDKYVREQIDSILAQSGCEVELLVRDDMSSDDTTAILEEYQKLGKLTWYQDGKNLGAAHSFWQLLQDAPEADYYSFADQDDVWKADKLCRGIKLIQQEEGPALSYSNAELVDADGKSLKDVVYHGEQKPSLKMALCSCNILGCTMVMNWQLIQIIKRMKSPKAIIMHDNFVSALCMACGGRIYYDNNPNMYYRQHGNNVVGVTIDRSIFEKIKTKWNWIMRDRKVSVSEQCRELVACEELTAAGRNYVEKVSKYKKNMFIRLQLSSGLLLGFFTKKATKHELLTAIAMFFNKV